MSEETKTVVAEDVMATTTHSENDAVVSAKTLLAAGCHFGHKVSNWNPKMKKYIYGSKNKLHIIDLNKTAEQIQTAYIALKNIVAASGKVIFVGTKPHAKAAIEEAANRSGSFYVSNRWLGGTLTNFKMIVTRIALLKKLEQQELDGEFEKLTKKEAAEKIKLKEKLSKNLQGIKEIVSRPAALVVVDPKAEHNAIKEAHALGIPVFALGDTNTNPDEIDYLIPANDDGEASIAIIVGLLADAVVEGKGGEPVYAYKSADEQTKSMEELLSEINSADLIKSIKSKLKNDAIAARKAGKSGHSKKRVVKKFVRHAKPANKEGEAAEKPAETPAAQPTTEGNK